MLAVTLDAEGVSQEVELFPGQTALYTADTADLEYATVYLQQSVNGGSSWQAAVDETGAEVDALVDDDGGTVSVSATLRNDTKSPIRYRVFLDDTAVDMEEIAGSVDVVIAAGNDAVASVGGSALQVNDDDVTLDRKLVAPVESNVIVITEYADNATALAAGLPLGALYHTAGVVAAVIEE